MKIEFTKEDIIKLAKLSMIEINDAEIESYRLTLSKKLNEIDEIREVEIDRDILIAPFTENVKMREDIAESTLTPEEILNNAPAKAANMIEVPVMINE